MSIITYISILVMKYILINLYSFLKFIWMFFYNSFCELLRSFKAVGLQIQNLETFRRRQADVKVCQTSRIVFPTF